MKIENHPNYVVLEDEKEDIIDFASFIENQVPSKYKGQNVVLNLLKYDKLELPHLLQFLKTSNLHRKTKQSFVIVNNAIDFDDVPFEMIVVPTLQEAGDIVEMEEIERDLGF
ncbi:MULTISPECIES: ribonuclease Z [Aequorivita]|uniref:Ribonuclease Z n=1 Tax=Aequorivita iocasae TaxID=2803865 RepID=A0ABX7DQA9_9FLAO|nr:MULTISPECIES: ribonuclease Z [Aequorivita]QQX76310.1 ribonuclease Z [Aequorivita iocasae]UCA55773.1 ribonuclease Z [Aequorivita sp. F7]